MLQDVSKSRTYVAICDKRNFIGFYLKKFTLPEEFENNSSTASWYFLNVLDFTACIIGCISFESYSNISEA